MHILYLLVLICQLVVVVLGAINLKYLKEHLKHHRVDIEAAIAYAWQLPRYESCEFAAAFVAGNKGPGGGVYLTESHSRHGDLDYRYEIKSSGSDLIITAYEIHHGEKQIFTGTLEKFKKFAKKEEE